MTSSTADLINAQIEKELEKLNDFMTFDDDKPVILNRIERLTAMLPNQEQSQSRREMLSEITEAIIAEAQKESGRSFREICNVVAERLA